MSLLLNIKSSSVEQTEALGEKLAASFQDRDVVVLTGPLGAGKTAFVRGLTKGRGLDPQQVNSPSYTFINEYPGQRPLYHFDLYRINDPIELFEIGWEDYLSRSGLVVVEWGEKAGEFLPEKYFLIEFEILGDNVREINLSLVQR
jgi:tRNA threonylcarbamoyladenosine biosynthesis protein TsaE